ncbi:MAG: histidine phosphatase family protein [Sulfurimonas sp.]|nr:histidine phosphatase family protein [Sulfurimonas sp.]
MRITLVRHCEVQKEYIGCYNGHNNIKLSKYGDTQAKELAKKLYTPEFDIIFCSDLLRAKESVKYFKNYKNIIYTDKLREKSWGKHEGLNFDEIIAQNEIKYIKFFQWIEALDGEPYQEYIKGIKKFFLEYLKSLEKENILIITHAGVIRTFLSIVRNISLEEAFKIKINYGDLIVENI